jgi:hypothetical protein
MYQKLTNVEKIYQNYEKVCQEEKSVPKAMKGYNSVETIEKVCKKLTNFEKVIDKSKA